MRKSVFTKEYELLLEHLRAAREGAEVTQEELAAVLQETQSFVSKVERGERRLDVVELRFWCQSLGISFPQFVTRFDQAVKKASEGDAS